MEIVIQAEVPNGAIGASQHDYDRACSTQGAFIVAACLRKYAYGILPLPPFPGNVRIPPRERL